MDDRAAIERSHPSGLYHGWLVVAAAFLVAIFGFGLGFYGPGIYLVALKARHGWSIAELSLSTGTDRVILAMRAMAEF